MVGLLFLPLTITIGILSPLGGQIVHRLGARLALKLASICYILGFGLLLCLLPILHYGWISIILILIGISFSFVSPAALTLGLRAVSTDVQGTATGIFYTVSVSAGLIMVTLCSAVLAHFATGLQVNITAFNWIMAACIALSLIVLLMVMIKR